jgi:hypothetical protein
MRKIKFICYFVIAAISMSNAQQIAVVSPQAITTLYTSLDSAIIHAAAGSTIYLSGGGFQINDNTKVTKKLVITGIGHRADNDHTDGNTVVSGNFYFNSGSDNSVLMGVYLSGNVYIDANNFLLSYTNVNSVQIQNSSRQRIQINQNYIRSGSNGGNSTVSFTNNVLHSVGSINGGVISHNVIINGGNATNSTVKDNIFLNGNISSSITSHNMSKSDVGNYCVVVANWADVLEDPVTAVSPLSNYHLKSSAGENAASDGSDIGLYGGSGFKDSCLPPIHRIVSKSVPEKTEVDETLGVWLQIKSE